MSPRETSTSSASRIVTDCGGTASSSGPSAVSTDCDARAQPRRQHDDVVARAPDAARDLAGVAAVVVVLVRHRPDHPLHREAAQLDVPVGGDLDRLEVLEQRRPVVPRHLLGAVDDVVAAQRRDRDHRAGPAARARRGRGRSRRSAPATSRRGPSCSPRRSTCGTRSMRDDVRVPLRLLDHAEPRVDEDDGDVGGGRAGDHVARVLHVTRRVGELEAAARRDERAVRDVDRDPLLALGAQPVGEQREVDVRVAAAPRRLLDVLELVDEDLLRVVEQPADQRRLAVVDRAARDETEQLRLLELRSNQRASGLPSRLR